MNKYLKTIGIISLFFYGCLQSNNCENNVKIDVKHFIKEEFKGNIDEDIVKYEKSIGSTIIFRYKSKDTSIFNERKNLLLNPKNEKWKTDTSDRYWNRCLECFSGRGRSTHVIALRTQNHPFIKEVAVYPDVLEQKYMTFYFYKHEVFDSLIPDSLNALYANSFNEEEFWCYQKKLFSTLDEYYGVGEQMVSFCEEPRKSQKYRHQTGEVFTLGSTTKWNGTKEGLKWAERVKKKFGFFEWVTTECDIHTDEIWIGTKVHRLTVKHEDRYEHFGHFKPEDLYIMYTSHYMRREVEKIIY